MSLTFQLDRDKAVAAVPEFLELYITMPKPINSGVGDHTCRTKQHIIG